MKRKLLITKTHNKGCDRASTCHLIGVSYLFTIMDYTIDLNH